MLKVIIIDDEFKSRELLKVMLLEYCSGIELVGVADDVKSGLEVVSKNPPDLLFLDVELKQETGFDLLAQIHPLNFEIIFITAHSHYAIKAIKFSAIDYLLKPLNPEELKIAVEKVRERRAESTFKNKIDILFQNLKGSSKQQKIALPTPEGLIFALVEDIIFCEADGPYTIIYLKSAGKFIVSKNLKEYELLLAEYNFLRVHNSYLINLNEIKRYIKGEGGYVIMSNDKKVDIAKRKKELFLSKITK